jgi:hypothetical protein
MFALILCLSAALGLCVALAYFSRNDANADSQPSLPVQQGPLYRDMTDRSYLNAAALTAAIFSRRDLEFIRREGSAELEKLFLAERKAVAAYWVTVTSSRISDIRKNHLTNSRFSRDLSPDEELRLLAQFLYLSIICRVGLLTIQVAGPMAPANLAAHIQRIASTLPVLRGSTYSRVQQN